MIEVRVHLYNSMREYGRGESVLRVSLPEKSTIADVVDRLGIPRGEIFLLLHNGWNISARLDERSDLSAPLREGDRLAVSGPVPFSRGYGAPVV